MSRFCMSHPVLSFMMLMLVCGTACEMADIIVNGKTLRYNKKETQNEEVESVKE